jgi:hypothetical protein
LVEHLLCKQGVAGSSPVRSTSHRLATPSRCLLHYQSVLASARGQPKYARPFCAVLDLKFTSGCTLAAWPLLIVLRLLSSPVVRVVWAMR